MKKRAVSILLAVVMLLSVLPTVSLAADPNQSKLQVHLMSENNGV